MTEGIQYQALLGDCGCDGDSAGLRAALGEDSTVLESTGYDESYEHSYNTIWLTSDGRVIHAECGGCSCGGSGSWSYETDAAAALRKIPEQERTR